MNKKKILVNIFSNWTNLVLIVVAALIVSPIIVHNLGNELYGIWVLIGSITGYFTVLDFGVNTALVRFISKYEAQGRKERSREIYSNAFVFFGAVGILIMVCTAVFAYKFGDLFDIKAVSRGYLYLVFLVVGIDLAVGMLFTVFLGTLKAVQEFLKINIVSISAMIIKNIVLVVLLLKGYGLLTLAMVQFITTVGRCVPQYFIIKSDYSHLKFKMSDSSKMMFRKIYDYSLYSFIISVALKVLFYTDSIVIGSMVSVSDVTFYAIPMTLILYLEQFVYAAMSVLTPVVSSYDAQGNIEANRRIYIVGSKYSLVLSLPMLFVVFTNGAEFISLWMGEEYGLRGDVVLKILTVGYVFSLSQVIANGILKGMSRHRVFAYILAAEALVNLVLSVALAPVYGIEGVAIGTAVPLIIANLFVVPAYTCRVLGISYIQYIVKCYGPFLVFTSILGALYFAVPISVSTYSQLTGYSLSVAGVFMVFSYCFIIEKEHKNWIADRVSNIVR